VFLDGLLLISNSISSNNWVSIHLKSSSYNHNVVVFEDVNSSEQMYGDRKMSCAQLCDDEIQEVHFRDCSYDWCEKSEVGEVFERFILRCEALIN
jgi:hypothetical protein